MLICSIKDKFFNKKMLKIKNPLFSGFFYVEDYEVIKHLIAEPPLPDFVILVFRLNFQLAL
jgi:hypothetical protein